MKYLITALTMFVLYLIGLLFVPDNYLLVLSILALIIVNRIEKAFIEKNNFISKSKSTLLKPELQNGNGKKVSSKIKNFAMKNLFLKPTLQNGNGKNLSSKIKNFVKNTLKVEEKSKQVQ